ncbi:hypothetical protein VE03_02716 [Pseudogymnoascus sp. 23342-1-I1]|nr:hypothetical protein VE03_02716 [Pseudogymnoascus sp. 23342-1-I1]
METWDDVYAENNDEMLPTDFDVKPKLENVEGGLVKKMTTFKTGSAAYCLVSYYSADEQEQGKLQRPSADPQFNDLKFRKELLEQYHKIPLGEHGRLCKDIGLYGKGRYQVDLFNTKGNADMPPLGWMGDAGMPAVNSYNSTVNATTSEVNPYNPMDLPALNPDNAMENADMPALDPSNPMADAGMSEHNSDLCNIMGLSASNPYYDMGDAGIPAFNSDNPIVSGSMPTIGSGMVSGDGGGQVFGMPSTFAQPPDPNPHEASAQASYQHSPYTQTHTQTTIQTIAILASTCPTNEDPYLDAPSMSHSSQNV